MLSITSIYLPISTRKVENVPLIFLFCSIAIKGFKVKGKSISTAIPIGRNLGPQFPEYSLNTSDKRIGEYDEALKKKSCNSSIQLSLQRPELRQGDKAEINLIIPF